MQSKTMNRTVLVIQLLVFNGMIAAVVRPVSILGITVMIVTEITTLLVVLRVLRKYPKYRLL